jgi:NNP family nitrate/nitrite transporter-like MFS transporter
MYWVLSTCALFFLLVIFPRMEIISPGEGILSNKTDTVAAVTQESITMESGAVFNLKQKPAEMYDGDEEAFIMPKFQSWQEPIVEVGQVINKPNPEKKVGKKKELIAKGVTRVFFQANVWVFTILIFLAGISMGIGKAAVYKHIPDYFPKDVGVVGGLVGVLGGLGGFLCPIIFGYMLKGSGVWTTCWVFLAAISIISLLWMHKVVTRIRSNSMEDAPPTSAEQETAS